jgi:hypothetical protein
MAMTAPGQQQQRQERQLFGDQFTQQQQRQIHDQAARLVPQVLDRVSNQVEYHIWNLLKDLAPTDPRANYVVDMVRSGQIKLTHLIGTDNIDQLLNQVRSGMSTRDSDGGQNY